MISSDANPTMLAKKVFDQIVEQVQSSNLNFQLSPFSATIFLKRSLVRDKNAYHCTEHHPEVDCPVMRTNYDDYTCIYHAMRSFSLNASCCHEHHPESNIYWPGMRTNGFGLYHAVISIWFLNANHCNEHHPEVRCPVMRTHHW